jgi:radical SAM protein with 4Fe4S-binding SPASM domain
MKNLRGYALELFLMLRVLSSRKLWNICLSYFSLFLSVLLRKNVVLGKPWAITVEPSSVCTLSCPECLVGMGMIRRPKFMSERTYMSLLAGLPQTVFYVNLYWQGEPLLDEHVYEKIREAKKNRLLVALSTNAQGLTREVAEKLVLAGLDKIIISMDGVDEETYLKYRQGGDFYQTVQALHFLDEVKRKHNCIHPLVEVQMILFDYICKRDINKKIKTYPHDKIIFKKPQYYHSQKQVRGERFVCPKLQQSLAIATTGDVVPCCQDKLLQWSLGNIEQKNVSDIWQSNELKDFRNAVSQGQIPLCQNCNFPIKIKRLPF